MPGPKTSRTLLMSSRASAYTDLEEHMGQDINHKHYATSCFGGRSSGITCVAEIRASSWIVSKQFIHTNPSANGSLADFFLHLKSSTSARDMEKQHKMLMVLPSLYLTTTSHAPESIKLNWKSMFLNSFSLTFRLSLAITRFERSLSTLYVADGSNDESLLPAAFSSFFFFYLD